MPDESSLTFWEEVRAERILLWCMKRHLEEIGLVEPNFPAGRLQIDRDSQEAAREVRYILNREKAR